ncbi:hypothetical protein [Mycobacteroides abscessus]|uniref:hypothetical protein n=1 Tax=Mycobacteroides abscessus TaxID=36809 RepID=UPI0009D02C79|nr:hypothetical protein [Mycobacteroides abscessus]MBN7488189.1 hypothetical protein [Mycobacteroides abscessus subsp. abscessus]SKR75728.1 Uncharacterised protein [Mycobacteroides abscessus subsp. massiliense]
MITLEYVAFDVPGAAGDTMRAVASQAATTAIGELLPRGVRTPRVYVFDRNAERHLVGTITCRPFDRGPDAVLAVAYMGRIAAVIGGTDLLVTWEEDDLDGPSPTRPAFAIADADLHAHSLTLVPFYWREIGRTPDNQPITSVVHQQPTDSYEGALMPASVHSLLHHWRAAYAPLTAERIVAAGGLAAPRPHADQLLNQAQQAGYRIDR